MEKKNNKWRIKIAAEKTKSFRAFALKNNFDRKQNGFCFYFFCDFILIRIVRQEANMSTHDT